MYIEIDIWDSVDRGNIVVQRVRLEQVSKYRLFACLWKSAPFCGYFIIKL